MKLSELIHQNEIILLPKEIGDIEVNGIGADSRRIKPGELFFSLDGSIANMYDAVIKGASAIVTDTVTDGRFPVPTVITKDAREAFALACLRIYGDPQKKLRLCAVTGTNGKTTTANMLSAILYEGGYTSCVIGTEGADFGGETIKTGYTTPPPDVLAPLLKRAADENIDFVVMEASSHALDQKRLCGLDFEVGIFTNLSRDHLDYHKSTEAYSAAKAELFRKCRHSVLNFDDPHAYEMAWAANDEIWYYSAKDFDVDFYADNIIHTEWGVQFDFCSVGAREHISSPLFGSYSVLDMLAAASAASVLGIKARLSARALERFHGAPGRMERIDTKTGFHVIIDFAHTPDAMKNVLSAARGFTPGRVITVFGCGGDRDCGKRAEMGKVACNLSDTVIITSDNPRSEEPDDIIDDIISQIKSRENYITEPDRGKAIELALSTAEKGDTVMLLGKGAESFIIAGEKKLPFSDKEQAENIILKKGL